MNSLTKPDIKTVFPTLSSTEEVINMAKSNLPITSSAEVIALLMTYHNTLVKTLTEKNHV